MDAPNSLVNYALNGFNASLILYGPAGVGKSTSLFGKDNRFKYMEDSSDLVSRILFKIFERGNNSTQIGISAFQIYKSENTKTEIVNDILANLNDSSNVKDFANILVTNSDNAKSVLDTIKSKCYNWKSKKGRPLEIVSNKAHLFIRIMLKNQTDNIASSIIIVDSIGYREQQDTILGKKEKELTDYANHSYESIKCILNELIRQAETNKSQLPKAIYGKSSKYSQYMAPLLSGNCKTFLLGSICSEDVGKKAMSYLDLLERSKKIITATTRDGTHETNNPSFIKFSTL